VKTRTLAYHPLVVALFVLLAVALPHHHHEGGAACYAVERCADDGRLNDEHTACGHAARPAAQDCLSKASQHVFHAPRLAPAGVSPHSAHSAMAGGGTFFPEPACRCVIGGACGHCVPSAALCGHLPHSPRRGPPFA
jgi:hypothetical protein